MLTAHLPSGYVLGRHWPRVDRRVMVAALVGAVVPDLDMIWFWFVDQGAWHHHLYWPHLPWVWALAALVAIPALWATVWRRPALAFFAAILLHLLLDSISGGIAWAAPVDMTLLSLVTVPASYGHWIISFVLHWTLLLELAVWAAAIALWVRR
jgi:inner membrane protein